MLATGDFYSFTVEQVNSVMRLKARAACVADLFLHYATSNAAQLNLSSIPLRI